MLPNPGDEKDFRDQGCDDYAGVTWSDIPDTDGRRIFIGWMGNWEYAQVVPTAPWRSAMTLPRSLTLHLTSSGLRVFSQPVRELRELRGARFDLPASILRGARRLTDEFALSPSAAELILRFDLRQSHASRFTLVGPGSLIQVV